MPHCDPGARGTRVLPSGMFGSHLSIAGALANALREAERLRFSTVQVFTKNQRQWRVPRLKKEAVKEWQGELERLGWDAAKGRPGRTVSHASYLINLASPDSALWRKSVDLMLEEIGNCQTLGISFLVHHPGAFTTSCREDGCKRIAEAYAELLTRTRGVSVVSCLENTAGGGSNMGSDFGELAQLRAMIVAAAGKEAERRIGFCFDTCHAHAAGYDMGSFEAANRALDEFDRLAGLGNIRVLHLNDSKGALGSRLDRHEHIGKGTIGLRGFAAVVNRPELQAGSPGSPGGRPMILETPKGVTEAGKQHDSLNLARLKRMMARDSVSRAPDASGVVRPLRKNKERRIVLD